MISRLAPGRDRSAGVARATFLLGTLAVAAVAVVVVFFYCPCSRLPGGFLLGDQHTTPVDDWSFANTVPLCQVEVDTGLPHSVNLNCMATPPRSGVSEQPRSGEDRGGRLYLSCANCEGKRWSEAALVSPDARLRLNGTVYPVRLTRIEDPAELDVAWRARAAKVGQLGGTGSNEVPPRAEGWWSFRVESR